MANVDDTLDPIVIDAGSGLVHAGFAGNKTVSAVFPTVVGKPTIKELVPMIGNKDCYIGDEVESRQELLLFHYPIQRGLITNWEDMERVWHYTIFDQLQTDPENRPIFMSEIPLNPAKNREKITQIMFETFNTPAFYLENEAMMSLYSSGRTTGLVLNSGHGVTHSVPVLEGFTQPHAIRRLDLGGRDVTAFLQTLVEHDYNTRLSLAETTSLKHAKCSCSIYSKPEVATDTAPTEVKYQLPDGRVLEIPNEPFKKVTEIMFQPSLLGLESDGIHQMILKSISGCDVPKQQDLFCNIIMSGGNTMLHNMSKRLEQELSRTVSAGSKFKVIAPPERNKSTWLGGSILASLSVCPWISKQEYNEHGPSIVHRKCNENINFFRLLSVT